MAATSFTLTAHRNACIEGQVATGRYGSGPDVMRAALRMMRAREARLSAMRELPDGRMAECDRGACDEGPPNVNDGMAVRRMRAAEIR